jgi:MoaA/NifB/PqqE/SkfB family radical SAM enzyme
MLPALAARILTTTDPQCLWKFFWNFGVKGMWSMERFKRRLRRGEYFPPFLHISIINSCNLRCQGCWVDVEAPRQQIDFLSLRRLIAEAKEQGNRFFGLLGGEPLMHPELLDLLAAHPDCYFQIFTNGQMITEATAAALRRLGNATPLISIEGLQSVSDQRRGKKDVFQKTMRGLENCVRNRLLTGVATSLCQSNINELLTETWLQELIKMGVHYVWYYAYRPVGPDMKGDLALNRDEQVRVRKFIVAMRCKMPIIIVDAYYDHQGRALCPTATGISHHIGPQGDIEPCPVIQFAVENIRDERGPYLAIRDSAFLRDYRRRVTTATRGCVVLERPDLVRALVLQHGARDTTQRGTALAEFAAMTSRSSQWLPGEEIPERHWMYRWAKRFWFHDFGAYRDLGSPAPGGTVVNPGPSPAERRLDPAGVSADNTPMS